MKKLLIVALILAVMPAFAVDITGAIDVNYFMYSANEVTATNNSESYFGMISTKVKLTEELAEGTTGVVKLDLDENASNGIDSEATSIRVEEVWVAKKGPFGQDALGFKFGKMEVPGNLDYDTGTTHSWTNMLEIDETWGFNVNYNLGEGMGTINLTTFEGMGGLDFSGSGDPADEDAGLFTSMVLQWDTGKGVDAFGVAGLRIVVAYGMIAQDEDADDASVISIGSTYTLKDLGLTIALEIDITTNLINGEDGTMLISLDADYDINEEFAAGLTYDMWTFNEVDINYTRIALRGKYKVAENNAIRLEIAIEGSDDDAENDEMGTTISLGYLATF